MDNVTLRIIFQISLAAFLGALIGFERRYSRKAAGMRTYALIALGSALFTILSAEGLGSDLGISSLDPSRIASQVVVGVGFLGAGLIFLQGGQVKGLTTAAGIWATAAMGMSIGFQMYAVAVAAAALIIFILFALWLVEEKLMIMEHKEDERD
ncbi:MAG: MgtC/SapB family protein [Candidatus Niyogibacteria bacterium]|nr:MgtC/SapB family protein [Candidatus Niyogibacteria bacterium]